jgi:mannonate dehydratase
MSWLFLRDGPGSHGIIHRIGERDKIIFVHFTTVIGAAEDFHETFVDCGNFEEFRAMKALNYVGFRGVVMLDYAPGRINDTC